MIKKGDFVEIEYTGRLKDPDIVFDTTDEKTAKENELYSKNMKYGPVAICIGEHQIIKGIDKNIEGKETGKSYTLELPPEDAFGKKSTQLIQLMPTNRFRKEGINPMPGLRVNIDGMMGLIKTVTGGRTIVDFNHPLSGKDIIYKIKINKLITDDAEKIRSYMELALNIKDIKVEKEEKGFKVELPAELPKEAKEKLGKKLKELVPSAKEVDFIIKKEEKK